MERLSCPEPQPYVVPITPQRLRPPAKLNKAERAAFADIVCSADATQFAPSDMTLLVGLARAIVAEDLAVAHLASEGTVIDGKLSAWVTAKEKAHKETIAYIHKLRLSPMARSHALLKPERAMSAYDRLAMEMESDGDEAH
jgi:hypothetical protein